MANGKKALTRVEVQMLKEALPNNPSATAATDAQDRALVELTKRGLLRAVNTVSRHGKEVLYYTTKLGKAALKRYLSRQ